MYFIFVRREVLLWGSGGEKVREAAWAKPAFRFSQKMRACSVYNGLILCRRHCFTIVAHNWKFWQMYFAWNIVLKLYMCICIVLWMYFLILTSERSVIFLSSCLLFCLLEDFLGTSPGFFQVSPTSTELYTVCLILCVCSLKRKALWLKQAWSLSGDDAVLFI